MVSQMYSAKIFPLLGRFGRGGSRAAPTKASDNDFLKELAKFSQGCNLPLISWFLLWLLAAAPAAAPCQTLPDYAAARGAMVARQLQARDITDPRVLAAMGKVPRHRFVPDHLAPLAYGDHPLPIGQGQTISQPYIVALMSQWAAVQPGDRVLEVGTGSGYQAAVLADLTDQVFTIEVWPELARTAAVRLQELGYAQVKAKTGDGYRGWPEAAPFDAILVTAAAPAVPPALTEQLQEGGRLVIPLGEAGGDQTLVRLRKVKGELKEEERLPVRFVPLVREPFQEPGR
jgi:protein-L-isoaspartate(D-aspartate) O-methyltransferase